MIVKNVSLLNKEQYEYFRPVIPNVADSWWLKTPERYISNLAYVVGDGELVSAPCDTKQGVRPVCIFEFDASDLIFWQKAEDLVGADIKFGEYHWTILGIARGEAAAICNEIISKRRFSAAYNDWNESELKLWLETECLKLIT